MNRPLPPQDDGGGCSGEGGSCSSSSGPPGTTLAGPTPSNGAPGASVKPAEGSAGENKNQIYAELETGLDPDEPTGNEPGGVNPNSSDVSTQAFERLPESAQIQVMQEKAAHRLLAQVHARLPHTTTSHTHTQQLSTFPSLPSLLSPTPPLLFPSLPFALSDVTPADARGAP